MAAVACVGFAPAVLLGAPAWAAASVSAAVVVLGAAVRQRHRLRWDLVPWRLVLLTTGLVALSAKMARADGVVAPSEIAAFRKVGNAYASRQEAAQ